MLPGDLVIYDFVTVYVLTSPANPGLVKICFDAYSDDQAQIDALYSSGVPLPFKVEFVCEVPNPEEAKNAFHLAFGPYRVNSQREIYQIEPEQAIVLLRSLHVEETAQQVSASSDSGEVDPLPLAVAEQFAKRRPNLLPNRMWLHRLLSQGSTSRRSGPLL